MALRERRGESSSPSLLSDLSSPDLSFSEVARKHNLTIQELTLLVSATDLRNEIAATESAACQRVRLISSLNLHAVARTLITVMDDFDALAKSHQASADPAYLTDPDYIRASDRARKAAWMLYRLSRIAPIDEAALARALIPAPAPARAPIPAPAPAPEAESNATANTHVAVAKNAPTNDSAPELPASEALAPAAQAHAPAHAHTNSPAPASNPSESAMCDSPSAISHLLSDLEQLSASLGIDTSDLDDPDNLPPLPPEFLALFPPELAAFLTESDRAPPSPDYPAPREAAASP